MNKISAGISAAPKKSARIYLTYYIIILIMAIYMRPYVLRTAFFYGVL